MSKNWAQLKVDKVGGTARMKNWIWARRERNSARRERGSARRERGSARRGSREERYFGLDRNIAVKE